MSTNTFKCYNCGANVIIGDNPNIGICSRCLAEVPIPKQDTSIMEAYSNANLLLSESRFDEALDAFREILVRAPLDAAACWGYAVSEYGIEFVQDPTTAELLPTLHRLSLERFSQYLYVQKAIEYAPDYDTHQFYVKQSQLIDSIQSHSLQLSQKEEPYDIFICYKKTEEGEKRTSDSRIAADLYKELTRRGYKTFFAEETLHVGEEYEPRIFAALNSARVMLAIGSKNQYYEAVWVRNEWSRYVDLIQTEAAQGKQTRLLIPVFYNIQHDQIPAALQKMPQYVDISDSVSAKQILFTIISNHFSGGSKDDVSDLRRQIRGQNVGSVQMTASAENYVIRGNIELVNGEFQTAEEMFLKANEIESSPDAYLGLLMCQEVLRGKDALHQFRKDIRNHPYFLQALSCAGPEKQAELEHIAQTCLENVEWAKVCATEQKRCDSAVKNTLNAVSHFTLNTKVHENCRSAESMISAAKKSQRFLNSESEFITNLRIFLFVGNLFPAVCLMLSAVIKALDWDTTVDWISIPGAIAMMPCYIVCVYKMLSNIDILDGGCLTVLIRIGAGYTLSMVVFTTAMEMRFLFLIISAIACILFYLTHDIKRQPAKRTMKDFQAKVTILMEQRTSMEQLLVQETLEALDSVTSPYRRYYLNDEWEDVQKQWSASVRTVCTKAIQDLYDELESI